ncbi:GNAT family N-acetyltransferase [Streptomyces sp. KLOTTS4A1]|uniref:GNAT family N-acetyltransferase n=1 Tax=Streptomyces sp. KLOTTS4A1 TaxID=3390996 RepID=UPI0039F4BB58
MPEHAHITPLHRLSVTDTAAWHRVVTASMAHDVPEEPPPTAGQVHAQLTKPALGSHQLTWLATAEDGTVTGVAALRLFTSPGQEHLAELQLHVDPGHRRRGTGSLLLSTVTAACRTENRRTLIAETTDGGPGEAFCARWGFQRALTLDYLRLDLDTLDTARIDELGGAEHPGYRLAGWTGTVPDELAEAFAAAKNAMNDMPVGELDFGTVRWDADRVRDMAKVVAGRGDTLLTVAALHSDGAMAGYTEIVLPRGGGPLAQQYDTAVVPAHRGHGLGLWVKAAMLLRLRAEHPEVTTVTTDNAEDNVHMLAVNRQLGFGPGRRTHEYQLELRPASLTPDTSDMPDTQNASDTPNTPKEHTRMSLTLTDQDKRTLHSAAHGAVALLAAADAAGSPHRISTHASVALASGTGPVGHVLAEKVKGGTPSGKSVAELADTVLPALTSAMGLLGKQDPARAEDFRGIVMVALEAGVQARKGEPSPPLTDMLRRITEALDAA